MRRRKRDHDLVRDPNHALVANPHRNRNHLPEKSQPVAANLLVENRHAKSHPVAANLLVENPRVVPVAASLRDDPNQRGEVDPHRLVVPEAAAAVGRNPHLAHEAVAKAVVKAMGRNPHLAQEAVAKAAKQVEARNNAPNRLHRKRVRVLAVQQKRQRRRPRVL
jgi:hypothetical protein